MGINKVVDNYFVCKSAYEIIKRLQFRKYTDFLFSKGLSEEDFSEMDDVSLHRLGNEYEVYAEKEIEMTKIAYEDYKKSERLLVRSLRFPKKSYYMQ